MNVSRLGQLGPVFCRQLLRCDRQLAAVPQRNLNANRAAVTRMKRPMYMRHYPTTTVLPDGSTITVKYPEPRVLMRLPIVLDSATEEQKRQIQILRRPKQTLKVTEDTGDSFDPMKYIKF